MTASDSKLFLENLTALSPYLPDHVLTLLQQYKPAKYTLRTDRETGADNLYEGDASIYKPNADAYSSQQVRTYLKDPHRFCLANNVQAQERPINAASVMASSIQEVWRQYFPSQAPEYDTASALISFGIGLGKHLDHLTENLDFRDLIILEPEFEFFFWSLQSLDWRKIENRTKANKGRIFFIFDDNPDLSLQNTMNALHDRNYGLIEGTYIYRHYEHPNFLPLANRLSEFGPNMLAYNGWVEDEIVHLKNHTANCREHIEQIVATPDPKQTGDNVLRPAIVAGSGPSLQGNIELVRELRDRIVLFSAGTSIGPLLKAGLTPDYHCELENVSVVVDMMHSLAQHNDLSGITLVASTTTDPELSKIFSNRVYFLREGDGVMSVMKGSLSQIDGVGPSGVNTAVRIAHRFGYKQIFLLGADFGSAIPDVQYSKGVAYENIDQINEIRRNDKKHDVGSAGSTTAPFSKIVPGNFGDTVTSNETLILMRHRLEALLERFDLSVYNLGNGARITGARPLPPDQLDSIFQADMRIDLSPQRRAWLQVPVGRFYQSDQIDELYESFSSVLAQLEQELTELRGQPSPCKFTDLYDRLTQFMFFPLSESKRNVGSAARTCMTGSLMRGLHMIRYCAVRTPDKSRECFLRTSLGIMLGLLPLWRSSILAEIEGIRNSNQRDKPTNDSIDEALSAIRRGDPGIDWPWKSALKEIDGKNGSIYLAQYIIKEYLRRKVGIGVAIPTPDIDTINHVTPFLAERSTASFLRFFCEYLVYFDDLHCNPKILQKINSLIDDAYFVDPVLLHFLAVLNFFNDNPKRALILSKRQSEAMPVKPKARLWEANYLLGAGDTDRAEDLFKTLLAEPSPPQHVFPTVDLYGLVPAIRGDFDTALSYYRNHPGWNASSPNIRFLYLIVSHYITDHTPSDTLLAESKGDGMAVFQSLLNVAKMVIRNTGRHDSHKA